MNLTQRVQRLVTDLIEAGPESAIQVVAYVEGVEVVNVAAGYADAAGTRPLTRDTLINGWSVGKGAVSAIVHRLVARGLLDLDTPVARYWPEFGANGKSGITLSHVLSHSAGVPQTPQPFHFTDLGEWDTYCARIAALPALWPAGQTSGYHGLTFGYILGEVICRVTGTDLRTALAEHVTGPLGIVDQINFGVTPARLGEVATLRDGGWCAMLDAIPPEANFHRAIPQHVAVPEVGNDPRYVTACYPGGAIVTARALARMYAAMLAPVDGVRLVDDAALARITTPVIEGEDWTMGAPLVKGLGYYLELPTVSGFPRTFGCPGSGSNMAFAEPDTGLAFAFIHTTMMPAPPESARLLAEAIRAAIIG